MANKTVHYIIGEGLKAAVEVASDLGMPLLVTGEPGTGKTQLAYYVAQLIRNAEAEKQGIEPGDEASDPRVLRFNTKTTSVARDLFYRFDAVGHFQAIHRAKIGDESTRVNIFDHLRFEPLGKAILAASEKQFVVLIDEIDKAPRDFPNDVLFEFEDMAFRIEEATDEDFKKFAKKFAQKPEFTELKLKIQDPEPKQGIIKLPGNAPRPVLILTSNSEKNLPDAFLRRCVFYHIPFPEEEDLIKIVKGNAEISPKYQSLIEKAVKEFLHIRDIGQRKKPSVAELIHWVEILDKRDIDFEKISGDEKMLKKLKATSPVLAKNKDDQEKLNASQESRFKK